MAMPVQPCVDLRRQCPNPTGVLLGHTRVASSPPPPPPPPFSLLNPELTHNNVAQSAEEGLSRSKHFNRIEGTSEGNLLTTAWRCDSKNLRPRSRTFKIWWITPNAGVSQIPATESGLDTEGERRLQGGRSGLRRLCIKADYQPLG